MQDPVDSVLELIGRTPMVRLKRISKGCPAEIWAKIEFMNPSGSVKDRIALKMIEEAERRGDIRKGSTIIEPTSGNTGVALAMVCALKGYRMIAVMPECNSIERIMLVQLYGAKADIVKCVAKEKGVTKTDMVNVCERARELAREIPNSFIPDQFCNPDNPVAHEETTAKEIIEQTKGKFHAFVAACGTGGTFTGVAGHLKKKYPKIITAVVEPSGSAVLSGEKEGFHKIQGIGEGFIPENMDLKVADRILKVSDEGAVQMALRLWKEEGIMAGISSGANVHASLQLGKEMKKGQVIVTLIPDNGMRYFSTKEFQAECRVGGR